MKNLLFVINNLHIGGIQKALISLLWNIHTQYSITLLLFYPGSINLKNLPPDVEILTLSSGYRYLGMRRQDIHTPVEWIGRAFYAGITRLFGRKYAVSLMDIRQKKIGQYDIAISYMHNSKDKAFLGGCNDFVLKHVSAKKKITVLHCDYTLSGADTPDNNRQYSKFDTIAACSKGCADAFLKVNPQLSEKLLVVPNCHRFDQIQSMAEAASVSMDPEKINIVTVSRFGKEKSVERALQAIAGLGSLKERIHYYIIGDGSEKPKLLETLEREQLSPFVTLCGQLENPYGYMQAADLLLIPSRSEAAPLVIGEAACLGTPVLSMKTSSAVEMIQDTGFGWVCENEEAAMTETLEKLIRNSELLREASQNLKERKFQNEYAISQFEKCLG